MRPHGHARADRHNPRAWGICDGCGFLYVKKDLQFQYEWAGNRLVNQNFLVCDKCYDQPQEQLRVIVLPADPTPIVNPRPEQDIANNNPVSSLGLLIGTMTQAAGLKAAFDSNINKPMFLSACQYVSINGVNSVGRNWSGLTDGNVGFTASRFQVWAPNDAKFLGSGTATYTFDGSQDNAVWTTLSTATTVGTVGEMIDVSITPTISYLYHRFTITGNGTNSVSVAQLKIYRA